MVAPQGYAVQTKGFDRAPFRKRQTDPLIFQSMKRYRNRGQHAAKEPRRSRLDDAVPLTARAWLVKPAGKITEPIAIIWIPGDEDCSPVTRVVRVGNDDGLEKTRASLNETSKETNLPVVITEGVDGIAAMNPDWDGKPSFRCDNPVCGQVHDVHLNFAQNLFAYVSSRSEWNKARYFELAAPIGN